jgi:hypothetical protein
MLCTGLLVAAAGLRGALIFFAAGNVLLGLYAVTARPARSLDPPG